MRNPDSQPRRKDSVQRANRTIVASWREHLAPLRPHAIDAGLAVVVGVAVTIAISVTYERGSQPPDALAYALGVTIGAFVLGRRRWPVGVLVASVVTLQVYYFANHPGIQPAVALAVALYTAAAAGYLRWSLVIAAWYWVPPLLFAVRGDLGPVVPALDGLVRDGAILLAVLLFGDAVRSHRALMAEASERLRRAEEDREREAQELRAARVIQQQLLPKELPSLHGWRIATYYQPAREVGGDFYDFLELSDGQVAIATGDVTDKGIPAALVMATTHSILRSEARGLASPGAGGWSRTAREASASSKSALASLESSSGATGSRRTTSPSWRYRGSGGRAVGGPRHSFGSGSGGSKDEWKRSTPSGPWVTTSSSIRPPADRS